MANIAKFVNQTYNTLAQDKWVCKNVDFSIRIEEINAPQSNDGESSSSAVRFCEYKQCTTKGLVFICARHSL